MPASTALTPAEHLAATIRAVAGPEATPRADQVAAVEALVTDRRRVLVVQATGWGKSAVYWGATAAFRAAGAGPTLVVSPLLALMRDQIAAAQRAGLRAATINSTNLDEWDSVFASIADGSLDVLLISPERLANPNFADRLPRLLGSTGLLVIDEAHCVSDWGFDFRPDYQRLTRTLLQLGDDTPVLATTATANERVTADVARQFGDDTLTLRGSLARSSLRLAVVPQLTPLERYAWVADALHQLAGSGIVYVLTVAETERVAGFLREQGLDVAAYSGQTENREELEDRLRRNEVKALVATSALGMGYDKPDLAFCVHLGSPASPVAYYQQVGRAGRALDDATAVLVPSESDERIWDYFATAGIPDDDQVERILDALRDGPRTVADLESATGLRRTRLDGLLKLLAVDDVVARERSTWVATGKKWFYDTAKWDALKKVRADEADLMRRYAHGEGCLMQFLQQALDDPDPQPCGRCSVCDGRLPAPGAAPAAETVAAAQRFFRGQEVRVEPRKLWPTGTPGHKGKLKVVTEGRALAFADDPAWQEVLTTLWRRDAEAPPAVLDGMVEVLKRWSRTWFRPTAIVPMPSRRYPTLIRSVADHLGRVGRLPVVEALEVSGRRPAENASSITRVTDLLATTRVRDSIQLDGPVLLVDDTIRSRWTSTVAAELLGTVGAQAVLPLSIHQLP
ncbi:ATP-dependent DNA helicase RecQ [Friedmanniella endophytica]|uniref:DNA 3'-5' helicase n=1 Tax=Microlunatus kandeliicorticis TaxID=1759536 RepID=A0A7W3P687_9ACTN|nr:DEAD/DEAH box helicase [Microlunatus kandeliicorticis]MBA8794713.1 ATP-dependent DNA helicase RecQ [Microlunatus kandeliicorticis]